MIYFMFVDWKWEWSCHLRSSKMQDRLIPNYSADMLSSWCLARICKVDKSTSGGRYRQSFVLRNLSFKYCEGLSNNPTTRIRWESCDLNPRIWICIENSSPWLELQKLAFEGVSVAKSLFFCHTASFEELNLWLLSSPYRFANYTNANQIFFKLRHLLEEWRLQHSAFPHQLRGQSLPNATIIHFRMLSLVLFVILGFFFWQYFRQSSL